MRVLKKKKKKYKLKIEMRMEQFTSINCFVVDDAYVYIDGGYNQSSQSFYIWTKYEAKISYFSFFWVIITANVNI